MPKHQIRLLGPWEYSRIPSRSETTLSKRSDLAGKMTAPVDWKPNVARLTESRHGLSGVTTVPVDWESLIKDVAGSVTFQRKFHCPTNLDAEDVWVILSGVCGTGSISLNGHDVCDFDSQGQGIETCVTQLLIPFNCLRIQITVDPETHSAPRGLFLPVILEIRS